MDWQSIQPLFIWLSEHPAWSGLIVFLIALSESLLIVGLVVPGTVLMFGVGTLVGTGVLGIQETLLVAFAGAVIGDGLSFWIGARYHQQLSRLWPLKNNPDYLARGKQFFEKHGGKSILFGRFIGPVRPVIPAVAGMMGMPGKYFLLINIISAAAWAPFYLLPGIVFGTSIGLASIVGTRLMVLILVLFVSTFLLVWLIRKTMSYIGPRISLFYLEVYRTASKHPAFGDALKAIIDPDTAERRGLYFFSFLIISSLVIVTLFAEQFSSSLLSVINELAENFGLLIRTTLGDQLMLAIWEFYSWPGLMVTISSGLIVLFFNNDKSAVKHLVLLLVLAGFSGVLFNWISEFILHHQVFFVDLKILIFSSFAGFLAAAASQQYRFVKRWLIFSLFSFFILQLVLVLLYFGRVNMTQVFASLSMSSLWVLLLTTAYRRHSKPIEKLKPLVLCVAGLFLISGSLSLNMNYAQDYAAVSIKHEKFIVTYQSWQTDISNELPAQREDMFGSKKQNMNLQWMGDIETIKQSLLELDWQIAMTADYRSILYWLKPDVSLSELRRLPQTHRGIKEILTMIKYTENNQSASVLQLWPSAYTIKESGSPLWIGSITRQAISPTARWLAYLNVEPLLPTELQLFEDSLSSQGFFVKRTKISHTLLIGDGEYSEK